MLISLFLTHIPVLSCACTVHLKPMDTEVCACSMVLFTQGRLFLQQWQSSHCPHTLLKHSSEGARSTWVAFYLSLWLSFNFPLYCCYYNFDFMLAKTLCCKETSKSCMPIPPIPACIVFITQDWTQSPEAATAPHFLTLNEQSMHILMG